MRWCRGVLAGVALCVVVVSMVVCASALAAAVPVVGEESAVDVASSSATLQAQIDPEEAGTTYSFQYGTSSSYGSLTAAASAGSGSSTVTVEAQLQGLLADTTYHYRVLASNAQGPTAGPDETFTTQPAGSESSLPDGREWELVSPPDKHGGSIDTMTLEGGVIQASENGGAITYVAEDPIVANPQGNRSVEDSQILSRRGPAGWSSEDIATPHNDIGPYIIGEEAEYRAFSPDLSLGLVQPKGETPLPPLGKGAEKTIYLRNNDACEPTPTEAIPTTCYLPLVTTTNIEVPGSKLFIPPAENVNNSQGREIEIAGASPDLSYVVLKENDGEPLTKGAPTGEPSLYEWSGGHLSLVSVLPDGSPANESDTKLGSGEHPMARHVVSDDGSRVVWSTTAEGSPHANLYLRNTVKGETIKVDAPEPGGEEGKKAEPVFQTASSDGSKIFFTDKARLTGNSTASESEGAADLYVFEVTSGEGERLAGRLTDLTVDPHFGEDGEYAAVQNDVIGASENGSYVYFVANGLLGDAGERGATPGNCKFRETGETCNLYVEHYGGSGWEVPEWIAMLSGEDVGDFATNPGALNTLTAGVSGDGRWLAFMSDLSLTGYDNVDAVSGVRDEEVYLFDAGSGGLVCVSCNPSGERPSGVFDPRFKKEAGEALLVDERGAWAGHWLAGSLPGWTGWELSGAFYQSRFLSDNGRLFFDAADGLVSGDVNGKEDVYEFEPVGVGGCEGGVASAGVVFVAGEGGCVGLISSGTSGQESAFLDASAVGGRDSEGGEGGGDVFFLTTSQLVPEDEDSGFDIYDAHECSAVSPCVSAAGVVSSPACVTADSCRAASSPQPGIFGAPPSATFSGAGNLAPAPVPAVVKAKPKTAAQLRAERLARALKACRREKSKAKRVACEKTARKKYGVKAKKSQAKRPQAEKSRGGVQ